MSKTAEVLVVCGLPHTSVERVAAILANHDDRYLLPELNLFMAPNVAALCLLIEKSQDRLGDGLFRAIAEIKFSSQSENAIEQAKHYLWQRSDWSCQDLLAELQNCLHPKQLVLIDLHLAWRPNYLANLEKFADFQLIHVLRHPSLYSQELSHILREQAFVAPEYKDHCNLPGGRIEPQIAWYQFHKNLQQLSQTQTVHRLPLEQLQAQPKQSLDNLEQRLLNHKQTTHTQARSSPLRPTASVFLQRGPNNAPSGIADTVMQDPTLQLELGQQIPVLEQALQTAQGRTRLCAEVRALATELGY